MPGREPHGAAHPPLAGLPGQPERGRGAGHRRRGGARAEGGEPWSRAILGPLPPRP
ncbi:hypothetical protein chiPu_0030919, partial [Chiloscyllium punctatum]|nr:hypothetical protein [Chiloscyllium punctatum]